ncbi:hypothetical protein F5Y06DRAFT_63195 [Hypoxylon sp. FL0890]|nr:hypothetical protein F5Y06DRAFT_63195 [Hypoxylon sp. FL0890]
MSLTAVGLTSLPHQSPADAVLVWSFVHWAVGLAQSKVRGSTIHPTRPSSPYYLPPLAEVRSTVSELDRQRWLDRYWRRRETEGLGASQPRPPLARPPSDEESTSESADHSDTPPRRPAPRRPRATPKRLPPPAAIVPSGRTTPPNGLRDGIEPPATPLTPVPPPKKRRRVMREGLRLQRESIRTFLEHLDVGFQLPNPCQVPVYNPWVLGKP